MKSNTSAKTFVISLAAMLLALVCLWLAFAVLSKALSVAFGVIHFVVAAIGILSCVMSRKQTTNVKLLWIVVIVLAPILGTLLWFLWGKKNT